jgi:hypothetical protein
MAILTTEGAEDRRKNPVASGFDLRVLRGRSLEVFGSPCQLFGLVNL